MGNSKLLFHPCSPQEKPQLTRLLLPESKNVPGIKRMRRQGTDWEITFAKDISNKELIQNIQRTPKTHNKKMTNLIKK